MTRFYPGFFELLLLLFAGVTQNVRCQTWRAIRPTGEEAYSLEEFDSLAFPSPGYILTVEKGVWVLRNGETGQLVVASVEPGSIKTVEFGLLVRRVGGTMLAIPRTLPPHGVEGENRTRPCYSNPVELPPQTDSLRCLERWALAYYRQGKCGLLVWAENPKTDSKSADLEDCQRKAHFALPPVYDSISKPVGGYVLAWSGGLGQLFSELGAPIGLGPLHKAELLNPSWLAAGRKNGWRVIHLPTKRTLPSLSKPKPVGAFHILIKKKSGLALLNSECEQVEEKISFATFQQGTQIPVIWKGGKLFLAYPKPEPRLYIKTGSLKYLGPFCKQLATFQTSAGLWGFLDAHGFVRIAPRYSEIKPFTGDLAAVKIATGWGLIDGGERFIAQPIFDSVEPVEKLVGWICYGNEKALLYTKLGIQGEWAKGKYDRGYVLMQKGKSKGLAIATGGQGIPAWYDDLIPAWEEYYLARQGKDWAVLNSRHEIVLPWAPRRIRFNSELPYFFVEQKRTLDGD